MPLSNNHIAVYYNGIVNGVHTVGKYIILLYEYVLKGLADKEFFYDSQKADKAITFIETFCRHQETRHDLIKLEVWQKAFIAVIFGIVNADGYRHFREVVLVIGRKNGKSILASAISAYMAYADGEYGAKIYCLAPKLDQAAIVFDNALNMILSDDTLSSYAKKRRSDVHISATNTTMKPIAFSAKKSDGYNPHLTVCDEIASWIGYAGIKQYGVMKSARGARKQPLLLSITTAGYENNGIYDDLIKRSTQFLNGTAPEKENRLCPFLYMIDDENKWDDIEELKKSNPNMDVSVSRQSILDEIIVAKNSEAMKIEFLIKVCNVKQSSQRAWLSAKQIEGCFTSDAPALDEFTSVYCVGGIDLSQTRDLTAACVIIERNGILYVFVQFFMPRDKVDEATSRDGVPYRIMEHKGWLTFSGDSYVDYNDVQKWFEDLVGEREILPLWTGYDRWSSQYLVDGMKKRGFHMDDVRQGENLTPVMDEFIGLADDGKIVMAENDLLKAHLYDTGVQVNTSTRRYKPIKITAECHIDGFVAIIDALCVRQKYYAQVGDRLKNKE